MIALILLSSTGMPWEGAGRNSLMVRSQPGVPVGFVRKKCGGAFVEGGSVLLDRAAYHSCYGEGGDSRTRTQGRAEGAVLSLSGCNCRGGMGVRSELMGGAGERGSAKTDKKQTSCAGRRISSRSVQPRIVTKDFFEKGLRRFDAPEIENAPLETLYLQVKQLCLRLRERVPRIGVGELASPADRGRGIAEIEWP